MDGLKESDYEPPERYKYDRGFRLGLKYGLELEDVPVEYVTPVCKEYQPSFADGYELGVRRRVVITSRQDNGS